MVLNGIRNIEEERVDRWKTLKLIKESKVGELTSLVNRPFTIRF